MSLESNTPKYSPNHRARELFILLSSGCITPENILNDTDSTTLQIMRENIVADLASGYKLSKEVLEFYGMIGTLPQDLEATFSGHIGSAINNPKEYN